MSAFTVKIARHRNAHTLAEEFRIEINQLTGTKLKGVCRTSALTERPSIDDATVYAASQGYKVTDVLTVSDTVTLLRAE